MELKGSIATHAPPLTQGPDSHGSTTKKVANVESHDFKMLDVFSSSSKKFYYKHRIKRKFGCHNGLNNAQALKQLNYDNQWATNYLFF